MSRKRKRSAASLYLVCRVDSRRGTRQTHTGHSRARRNAATRALLRRETRECARDEHVRALRTTGDAVTCICGACLPTYLPTCNDARCSAARRGASYAHTRRSCPRMPESRESCITCRELGISRYIARLCAHEYLHICPHTRVFTRMYHVYVHVWARTYTYIYRYVYMYVHRTYVYTYGEMERTREEE